MERNEQKECGKDCVGHPIQQRPLGAETAFNRRNLQYLRIPSHAQPQETLADSSDVIVEDRTDTRQPTTPVNGLLLRKLD